MLEILFISWYIGKVQRKALEKHRNPKLYVLLALFFWVGAELLGFFLGKQMGLGLEVYAIALLFAFVSSGIVWLITSSGPDGSYETESERLVRETSENPVQLTEPAEIVLTREKNFVGALASLNCYLNGNFVGSIGNGERIAFFTSMRENVLQLKDQLGNEPAPYRLSLEAGDHANVFFNRKFLPERTVCRSADNEIKASPVMAEAPGQPAQPKRVLWASVWLFIGGICFHLLGMLFRTSGTNFQFSVRTLVSIAIVACSTTLFLRRKRQSSIFAGIAAGIALFYNISSLLLLRQLFGASINIFISAGYLAAQLLLSTSLGWAFTRPGFQRAKRINWAAAGIGAALSEIVLTVVDFLLMPEGIRFNFIPSIFYALFFGLFVVLAGNLGELKRNNVRLRGFGLFWAWLSLIAMIGSLAGLIIIIVNRAFESQPTATLQIALLTFCLAGYLMLIRKKRVGLFFIFAALLLGTTAQLIDSFMRLFYAESGNALPLFTTLAGLANPLITWLAVRSGDATLETETGHMES